MPLVELVVGNARETAQGPQPPREDPTDTAKG